MPLCKQDWRSIREIARKKLEFESFRPGQTRHWRRVNRPNIHLSVRGLSGENLKLRMLLELLGRLPKPGIVYAATHDHTEEISEALIEAGHQAVAYHGGLKRDDRETRQSAFMSGQADVIVATSAFGMSIDKRG